MTANSLNNELNNLERRIKLIISEQVKLKNDVEMYQYENRQLKEKIRLKNHELNNFQNKFKLNQFGINNLKEIKIEKKIKTGAEAVRKKRIQKGAKNLAKDAGIKITTQSPEKAAATQAAKDIGQKDLTPDVRQGMKSVAAGKGKSESLSGETQRNF